VSFSPTLDCSIKECYKFVYVSVYFTCLLKVHRVVCFFKMSKILDKILKSFTTLRTNVVYVIDDYCIHIVDEEDGYHTVFLIIDNFTFALPNSIALEIGHDEYEIVNVLRQHLFLRLVHFKHYYSFEFIIPHHMSCLCDLECEECKCFLFKSGVMRCECLFDK